MTNLKIKVPVYSSVLESNISLENGLDYDTRSLDDMVNSIIRSIEPYAENKLQIKPLFNRNKTYKTVVQDLKPYKYLIKGKDPCVLLQFTAYTTNHFDGFLETQEDQKIELKKKHKLGSDYHFLLIYPVIHGKTKKNFKYHYLILIYEDPHKDSNLIMKASKQLIKKVLELDINNIKKKEIFDELEKGNTLIVPQFNMKFSSIVVDPDTDEVDLEHVEYLYNHKKATDIVKEYVQIPLNNVKSIIEKAFENSKADKFNFYKKVYKLIVGKTEYRIKLEQLYQDENKELIKDTYEKIFNSSIEITEDELSDNIYDHEFILEKLSPIISNYVK
ncbi:hypothetical protein [Aureibacter tunicatorum]|uniref:Uncharacterized protein n=1 Tax=Aureibacter tunicatorum TaxID=866807 RepID=A0AAE4BUM7_9BACT|nr:hypothetical protein [Aureibacter tunicatorum]MDR6240957.1 hypothetical protein [Aureibacter tunicatorum]BDD03737.1 hypothetical protein AUTU_12200 [Aureibacter tunicatorum]